MLVFVRCFCEVGVIFWNSDDDRAHLFVGLLFGCVVLCGFFFWLGGGYCGSCDGE